MPKWTNHVECGTLRSNHFGYVLDMDGGGFWVLEMWGVRKPQCYLGQRVTVEGARVGFNILSVDRLWREDEPRPLIGMQRIRTQGESK